MKESGALYRLIKSLTQNEKRYFTLMSSAHGDSSDYQRIFKAIDEQPGYNESSLKESLAQEGSVDNFAVKKNQLYKLLLRSLRNYHEGRTFDTTLKEMMLNASILSDKALYRDCHHLLKKAYELAWQYEEWKILLEILHREFTISRHIMESGDFEKEMYRYNKEEDLIIHQLNNYGILANLHMKLSFLMMKPDDQSKGRELKKLMSHRLLSDERQAISFRAKSLYLLIHSSHALYRFEYEKAEKMLSRHLELYEAHPQFISASPGNYLNAWNELILVHFRMKRYNESLRLIRRLQQLPETSKIRKVRSSRFKAALLSWTFPVELGVAMKNANPLEEQPSLKPIEEYFVRHAHHVDPVKRAETYLALAAFSFHCKDHRRSVHFIQKILNDSSHHRFHEVTFLARSLQVIIHFEDGNIDLLPYLLSSLKRQSRSMKQPSESERFTLEFLRSLPRIRSASQKREAYTSALKQLELLKQNRREHPFYDFFDMSLWLKSSLNKRASTIDYSGDDRRPAGR